MSAGRFGYTPWAGRKLRALGIDPDEVRTRVPDDHMLHAGALRHPGMWVVRLYRTDTLGDGRRVSTQVCRLDPVQDLGHGIDYALAMAKGAA